MSRDQKDIYRRLALYSSLIFMIPLTVVGGLYLGLLLDGRFGTAPLLMLIGFLFGVIGAAYEVIRILGLK